MWSYSLDKNQYSYRVSHFSCTTTINMGAVMKKATHKGIKTYTYP